MENSFLQANDIFLNYSMPEILSLVRNNSTNDTQLTKPPNPPKSWIYTDLAKMIPFYVTIFLLSVCGNLLVIFTLATLRRMRTITNLFLLNLSISDLFLGVFCMPFTLIGSLLRNFIFGNAMCKLLPYFQATSVAVSAWTLVAISVERYFAICHPLRSRSWQTKKHVYKAIVLIWGLALLTMVPIASLSKLIPTSLGRHKCREDWPALEYEQIYNILLCAVMFVIPLFVLILTYSMISITLCEAMKKEARTTNIIVHSEDFPDEPTIVSMLESNSDSDTAKSRFRSSQRRKLNSNTRITFYGQPALFREQVIVRRGSARKHMSGLRKSNPEKSLLKKKRVIKMLFVVVLEFFICWTPLYVINTLALFNPKLVYEYVGFTAISIFQLLAYSSACCNPITYCFMNTGFRKAFISLFRKFTTKPPNRKMSCDIEQYNSCTIAGDSSGVMTTALDSINKTDYSSILRAPCSCPRNEYL